MAAELRIVGITAGYGPEPVVRAFSATCPPAALSVLLGPNGAGKTTLLRALSGYIPLRGGRTLLSDTDLSLLAPRERARYVAVVPQVAQDTLSLTIRETLALARYPQREGRLVLSPADRHAVEEALSLMDLQALADRPCATLSGGEWRRVLIAQGLVQDTPVLLLDEPTAFLDPPARRHILHRVRELARQRALTVLMVLHDIELAREYAAHVLLMRGGERLAEGRPERVLAPAKLAALYDCEPRWLGLQEDPR